MALAGAHCFWGSIKPETWLRDKLYICQFVFLYTTIVGIGNHELRSYLIMHDICSVPIVLQTSEIDCTVLYIVTLLFRDNKPLFHVRLLHT